MSNATFNTWVGGVTQWHGDKDGDKLTKRTNNIELLFLVDMCVFSCHE